MIHDNILCYPTSVIIGLVLLFYQSSHEIENIGTWIKVTFESTCFELKVMFYLHKLLKYIYSYKVEPWNINRVFIINPYDSPMLWSFILLNVEIIHQFISFRKISFRDFSKLESQNGWHEDKMVKNQQQPPHTHTHTTPYLMSRISSLNRTEKSFQTWIFQ